MNNLSRSHIKIFKKIIDQYICKLSEGIENCASLPIPPPTTYHFEISSGSAAYTQYESVIR